MEETCAVCGTALARSDILYAPDGRVVCPKHFAEIDPSAGGTSPPWRMSAIAGGIAGAIPFGIHMSSSSMSTVNGHVTSFVYRDWFAVICGVIAMICGVLTVVAARKEQLRRALAFAAGIGVLALGGVQIARGFGVFESPGDHSNNSTSMSVSMQREHESPPAEPAPPPDATKTADCADANACMELAQKLRAAKDGAGALAAFEHACEKGSPEGCYTAGDWLAQKPEWSKALPLYQHGCELGSLDACSDVGYAYVHGNGVDKDPAKAKEITCDAGADKSSAPVVAAAANAERDAVEDGKVLAFVRRLAGEGLHFTRRALRDRDERTIPVKRVTATLDRLIKVGQLRLVGAEVHLPQPTRAGKS